MTPQGGTLGRAEVEKIFCRNFANKLYIRSSYEVLITKKHKIRKNLNNRKNDTPRDSWGTLGPAEVEKIFCRNFANKLYIRSSYGVLITKNTKLEKNLNNRKNDTPRGDPGACGGRKKFFVEILQTNYIFGVHMGSSSQKTQN